MNIRIAMDRTLRAVAWVALCLLALLALPACGTFEIGVEGTAAPSAAPATPSLATSPTATPRPVARMMTPTPTYAPDDHLRIAFYSEGDVWLWQGDAPVALTHSGDISEGDIRISDDGAVVAFARGRELWAVDADGTNERRLVSEADLDRMPPLTPGVYLYRYAWVPGTHTIAFNTYLRKQFEVDPTDDLHLVDADTLEHTSLLAPGDGGHFYHSPDGGQIAIVRSGVIDLIDADGGNLRTSVLTYTPSPPSAEVRYYAEPTWAADGTAVGVAIPPPDPHAQPAQNTTLWRIPVDGTQGRIVASLPLPPMGPVSLSPDLSYAAYVNADESASPDVPPDLVIVSVDDTGGTAGSASVYARGVFRFAAWAPDAQRFAFVSLTGSESMPVQAEVGRLGYGATALESEIDAAVIDVRWVDDTRYVSLARDDATSRWLIRTGRIGGPRITVASIPEMPGSDVPEYDLARVAQRPSVVEQPTVRAVSTPTPVPPTVTRLPALRVAYVVEGNVWLWVDGSEALQLAGTGDAIDVRMSDDGEIVAFVRDGGEMWMVRADGTDVRALVTAADFRSIEPLTQNGFPVILNRFEWAPGTHTVAFNTRLDVPIGLVPNDDLHLVDADSLAHTQLLGAGEGGEFAYSPDGRQIAIANSGGISLIDADGGRLRDVLSYSPVATASEHQFYASPVWAADSSSLRVALPPADIHTQPPQSASVWHLPTDGTPASLIRSIAIRSGGQPAFSPDLRHAAYLEQGSGSQPEGTQGGLLVTELDTGLAVASYPDARQVYGWSPDAQYVAYMSNQETPRAMIAPLAGEAVPVYGDPTVVTIDVNWVDETRYLFLIVEPEARSLVLGAVDGTVTVLAEVSGRSFPSFDWAY